MGATSTGSTGISSETVGNGGKKSGMCSGGSQLDVRGLFRGGDDGLDMGDRGNSGEGRRLAPALRGEEPTSMSAPFGRSSTRDSSSLSSSESSSSSLSRPFRRGVGQRAYCSGIASSWSCRKPSASWAERNETDRVCSMGPHTLKLVQILDSSRGVECIAIQVFTLRSTVFAKLFHTDTELIQDANRISNGQAGPSCMLRIFRTARGQKGQVPREEICENR